MKHKFISMFLALAASVGTMVASDIQVDGVWYNFNSSTKTAEVTYEGSSYDSYSNDYNFSIVIPSSVTYKSVTYSVTGISDYAFYNCEWLQSVVIPNSVTNIGHQAFSKCPRLIGIVVESGNTVYDSRNNSNAIIETSSNVLIAGCLKTVIPNSVTSIGSYAFSGCTNLTSIEIPNSVTSIGSCAFTGCTGLTSITIGNSVTSIGDEAFYQCSGLTSITIPNSVTSIGDRAFYGCTGLTSLTIGNSVTSIGYEAFYKCTGLKSIEIPNSVTSIGSSAFSGCTRLTNITIGNSVTSIKSHAFSDCTNLPNIEIPNSVTKLGGAAFKGCTRLTNITIGNSVTSIETETFSDCTNLPNIEIPNSVTSIGGSAFSGCTNLTCMTIPNSVTSIGSSAFNGCTGLTSITIGNSVTSIETETFRGCTGLTSIEIPNSVKSIRSYAFYGCTNLTNITFGNSVKSIDYGAFGYCSSLTSVELPNSVTSIGGYAFYGCSGLTSMTIEAKTPPRVDNIYAQFLPNASDFPIYVPCSTINAYKEAPGWRDYAERIQGIGGCKSTCQDVYETWLQTGGSGFGDITTENNSVWTYNAQYGAVGKKQGGDTGWLLTPEKDLRGMESVTLLFSHTHKFATNFSDEMSLWVCDNYQGSVESSTWNQLTISPYASNSNWTFVDVTIDIPLDKVGEKTVFGFKYVSTASNYSTWQIKNLKLDAICADEVPTTVEVAPLVDQQSATKVFRDNQLFILRDGKTYTVHGQMVK